MRRPQPIALFWTAAAVDIVALGVAWSTWKLVSTSPIALLAAIPATLVCVAATTIAGRVLTVITRATQNPSAARPRSARPPTET